MEAAVRNNVLKVFLLLFSMICSIQLTETQVTILPDPLKELIKIKELILGYIEYNCLSEAAEASDYFTYSLRTNTHMDFGLFLIRIFSMHYPKLTQLDCFGKWKCLDSEGKRRNP